MPIKSVSAGVFCAVLAASVPAYAATVVTPGAFSDAESDAFQRSGFSTAATSRFQQVVSGSEFGTSSIFLTGFSFRPNVTNDGLFNLPGQPFTSTMDGQIDLSTTSAGPDTISTVFADNIGGDVTSVIPRQMITYSSAKTGCGDTGPCDFDTVFSFDVPFLFDPTAGNLLLDLRKFSAGFPVQQGTAFDSTNVAGDSVGSVAGISAQSLSGQFSTNGYIIQFMFEDAGTDVPAPAALGLLGLGIAAMGAMRRRRVAV